MPFANPLERATHFVRHGAEFGCATEAEYEVLAEQFLFGPMEAHMRQCVRPKGNDRLRFRAINRVWGSLCNSGVYSDVLQGAFTQDTKARRA